MTNLYKACLYAANLRGADLSGSILRRADLRKAKLHGSHLIYASMVNTRLEGAVISDCNVHGISAWELKLNNTIQRNLIITPLGVPEITVDNLEVAQFIYLLLHNEKVREVIDNITSKFVLILGRFTPERKVVLDAIREELRNHHYVPVLFDFNGPASRDLMETVSTLAHMARFIIVDITDPKSVPAELEHIVPDLPSVPVIPLILRSDYEYALFKSLMRRCSWVMVPCQYESLEELIASIGEKIIIPAEHKAIECRPS